ncbi:Rap1 GTPase-GDP dissociation stimulator 1, partial [Coemansia sp. RSA 2320]
AFKALADQCRSADTRAALTQTPHLADASSTALTRTLASLQTTAPDAAHRAELVFLLVQVLRCIGNHAADNDAARAQLLASGAVAAIAHVLVSVPEAARDPLARAAFGAALNVALDNEPCAAALIANGALLPHIQQLTQESPAGSLELWPVVCAGLDGLCEHALAPPQFEAHSDYILSILRALARLARRHVAAEPTSRGAMRTLLWVLCETLEKSAAVRRQLCRPESVLSLFDLLDFYLTTGIGLEEQAEVDDSPHPLPPNRPIPQPANRYADAATQAIVAVSGEDAALEALFPSHALMARLVAILTANHDTGRSADSSARADAMAAAAALCLGNLARSDEHCTQLLAPAYAPLIRTLIHEWFAPRSVNVRTRHAASGLLKNLCLPAANRSLLVEFGLVSVAAANISTAVVPIQANSIGMLRHLASGSPAPDSILSLVGNSPDAALPNALQVVASTDVDAIRCEGTRLIATIVKRVYLSDDGSGGTYLPARKAVEDACYDLATPLVRLILRDGVRHPLLRQESLVALTVLAATGDKSRHVKDIVRLLVPANSIPLAAGPPSESDEEQNETTAGFADVLAALIANSDPAWPQASLQAKSLVSQLNLASSSLTDGDFTNGLEILHSKLAPLLN